MTPTIRTERMGSRVSLWVQVDCGTVFGEPHVAEMLVFSGPEAEATPIVERLQKYWASKTSEAASVPSQCQAIVEDFDRPKMHWHRKVMNPGSKQCSRAPKTTVGSLALCTAHAKLAREGFMRPNGQVHPRADIRNARNAPALFPHGLEDWQMHVERKRPILGAEAPIVGSAVCALLDGCEIWRLEPADPRSKHHLCLVQRVDRLAARRGKPVLALGLDDQDHVEWAQLRASGECKHEA